MFVTQLPILLGATLACTMTLIGLEISTWVIHARIEVWLIRILRILFAICVAGVLSLTIFRKEMHFRSNLLAEKTERQLAEHRYAREAAARENSEAEVRRSYERTLMAMNAAGIGFWDWDVIRDEHVWSDTCKAMLGLSPDSLVNFQVLMNSVHPDDREMMRSAIDAATREKREYALEFRVIWPDGSVHWQAARGRAFHDDTGRTIRMTGVAMDIDKRKFAEERLRLQAAALEAAANSIVITDTEGTILWTNRAFSELTGYSAEEAWGKNPRLLSSGKHDQAFYTNLWQTITAGKVWCGKIVNRRKDGSFYTEEQTVTPVRSEGGDIAHFVAIKYDVTEREVLEQQLRQAQKMEAVGRLAGGVAHDFNNALGVITGYSELLQLALPAEAPLRKHADEILKAGRRAASLTQQLLAFSRKQPIQPALLDLNSVVTDVDKMLRRLIGEDIDLEIHRDSSLKRVKADRGQIEQILMNLAVNARDAMQHGGKLLIETASTELDDIYLRQHPYAKVGRYVMLSVSDSGCGMDKETQTHIFEPFFTTKELGKGTGLGLSTVYGIVKQSDGCISVYSEVGKGTTFRIYLPEVEATAQSPERESTVRVLARGTETILLVEDEDALRGLTLSSLQSGGYTVLEARDGKAATEVAQQHNGPIDLLLTDVIMPGISGRELADHLLKLRPAMRLLFMSGYTHDLITHHGALDPGTALLEKPFGVESLLTKVREVLDGQFASAAGTA